MPDFVAAQIAAVAAALDDADMPAAGATASAAEFRRSS
jgi:hypothetical protein